MVQGAGGTAGAGEEGWLLPYLSRPGCSQENRTEMLIDEMAIITRLLLSSLLL